MGCFAPPPLPPSTDEAIHQRPLGAVACYLLLLLTCALLMASSRLKAVGHGSGMLAAPGGGSYTSLVSPDLKHFTVIIEKLEGRCLRCAGQTTKDETVTISLSGGLEHAANALQVFATNETNHFVSVGTTVVKPDGTFTVQVGKDSIVTVSNWFNGQGKAVLPVDIPANTEFPTAYAENFEALQVDAGAKFFADNGGSFQAAEAPAAGGVSGMVYKQWSEAENGVNRWGGNVNPISLIGNASWVDVTASVAVLVQKNPAHRRNQQSVGPLPPTLPPQTPPRLAPGPTFVNWQSTHNSECLDAEGWMPRGVGSRVNTRSCVTSKHDAFTYDHATGQWRDEVSNACVGTGMQLVPCGDASGLWQWNPEDGTVRVRGNASACLQTASTVLDANVFVGECSSPRTDQQTWENAAKPAQIDGTACHQRAGDDCSGCQDQACCDSYYVPGKKRHTTYNCVWDAAACSQSTSPCGTVDGAYAGLCVRTDTSGRGVCLILDATGTWTMGGASGNVTTDPTTSWTKLGIIASGGNLTAVVNGISYAASFPGNPSPSSGMVSINSGFNVAYFDNFSMAAL